MKLYLNFWTDFACKVIFKIQFIKLKTMNLINANNTQFLCYLQKYNTSANNLNLEKVSI